MSSVIINFVLIRKGSIFKKISSQYDRSLQRSLTEWAETGYGDVILWQEMELSCASNAACTHNIEGEKREKKDDTIKILGDIGI